MRWITSKFSATSITSLHSTYWIIVIKQTGNSSDRDVATAGRSRKAGVDLAIDWMLNLVDLHIKKSSDFINIYLIGRILIIFVTYYVSVVTASPAILLNLFYYLLNIIVNENMLIVGKFNIPEYVDFRYFLSLNYLKNTNGRLLI